MVTVADGGAIEVGLGGGGGSSLLTKLHKLACVAVVDLGVSVPGEKCNK